MIAIGAAIVAEQLASGFGSIGLKLTMMQSLASGPYRTAHFAFATSLSGVGVTAVGMMSGSIERALGYRWFFGWTIAVALPIVLVARSASLRLSGEALSSRNLVPGR